MNTTTQTLTRPLLEKFIFVIGFLERAKTSETLRRMRTRRKNLWSDDAQALLEAILVMETDATRCVQEARSRGQLLFCFEGTTVLEGGAA